MTDHKRDEMLVTGAHRAWVGEPTGPVVRAGNTARDPQRNWLDRTQPANPRHAAITKSLYSWSNYKSWSDKVRNTWEREKPTK
jgi:hypothetical protein